MPHYLIRASYNPGAVATLVKSPQNRRATVQKLMESVGGKVEAFYYAFGEDDFILIVEAPDNVSAAAASLAAAAGGALSRIATTVLMTPEEATEAMRKAGAATYQAPS